MMFHKIYGNYYNAVTAVLNYAVRKPISRDRITDIIQEYEYAFEEMTFMLPDDIGPEGRWSLLDKEGKSILNNQVDRPLTILEKRWIKSLLSDPRIKLFQPDETGLEDVEPLFDSEDFVYYDQYQDGDPYVDEHYIEIFRSILEAVHEQKSVQILYQRKNGTEEWQSCNPIRIEYSQRDDKFRVLSSVNGKIATFNIAKISEVRQQGDFYPIEETETKFHGKRSVELLVEDTGRILERLLLQFSIYERTTECIGEHTYKIILNYEEEDETDLLIRILSFGPRIKVIGPKNFVKRMRYRLGMQKNKLEM